MKSGSGALRQDAYNGVITSRIMEQLNIPYVLYAIQMVDGLPCSVC